MNLRSVRLVAAHLAVATALSPLPAAAQHEGHGGSSATEPGPRPAPEAPSISDLELRRNGSGTAWQPEATPHAALHGEAAGVELMLHALLFGGYDAQGTDRGASEPVGVGWVMGMARRRFDNATLTARVMLSPEPWSAGYSAGGYPLLLLDNSNVVFARGELVQKGGFDLVLAPELDEARFWLGALGLGYLRNIGVVGGFVAGLGARGLLGLVPTAVEPFYGTRDPVGGMVFLRLTVPHVAGVRAALRG